MCQMEKYFIRGETCNNWCTTGSILGPLSFILFVNDYPKCLKHSNITIYADDSTKDISHKSIDVIEQKLHEDLLNSMQ